MVTLFLLAIGSVLMFALRNVVRVAVIAVASAIGVYIYAYVTSRAKGSDAPPSPKEMAKTLAILAGEVRFEIGNRIPSVRLPKPSMPRIPRPRIALFKRNVAEPAEVVRIPVRQPRKRDALGRFVKA